MKRIAFHSFLLIFVLAIVPLLLTGCSESTSPEEEGDTTPPALLSVSASDILHVEVKFDENVDKITAEHLTNYEIYRGSVGSPMGLAKGPSAYGDTLIILAAALLLDAKTVLLTIEPSFTGPDLYSLIAHGVKDIAGNAMSDPDTMTFSGVITQDVTPPEIIDRSPASGAVGVGIGQSVVVTFSEPMDKPSVMAAFSLTGPGGLMTFETETSEDNVYIFTPTSFFSYGTQYTASFAPNSAMDWNSNYLAGESWFFTTTNVPDNTPPTVVSTYPADGTLNVPVAITMQITFSEVVDPNSLLDEGIAMNPDPGYGILTWSNGGKTLNFDPDSSLTDNTNYSIVILQGTVSDFAGNKLASSYTFNFSTGSSFPAGSISGTISGDPNSDYANDPQGAIVIAGLENLFTYDEEGPPPIGGGNLVGADGSYLIQYLADGYYWPISALDSNGDGKIDPGKGDALGVYGVDFSTLQGEPQPDSVTITGGNHVSSVDFTLFDPISISGTVYYIGSIYTGMEYSYNYYVGFFDTAGFDTTGGVFPNPVTGTDGTILGSNPNYYISSLEDLTDGTYYVGAFLDVNGNDSLDLDIDPTGMYEVGGSFAPVNVERGRDAMNIDIFLNDPGAGTPFSLNRTNSRAGIKFVSKANPRLRAMLKMIAEAVRERKRQ